MTFMNDYANVRQFALVRHVNENSSDDHVVSKITIVLRRDKIEAPYYMNTKVKLSTCLDNPEGGLTHAMDMVSHNRMHNLTQEKYALIKSLISDLCDGDSNQVSLAESDEKLQLVLISRSDEEFFNLSERFHELFDLIDGLVD